jgi:ribonuclease VapC
LIVVIDASAIVAIVAGEPEALPFSAVLATASEVRASPVNLMEAGLALVLRDKRVTRWDYERWLELQEIEVSEAVDWTAAFDAYLRFGRSHHRAGLNLGDCFAYALAKALDAPLLYKGNDFTLTDIRPALQPT